MIIKSDFYHWRLLKSFWRSFSHGLNFESYDITLRQGRHFIDEETKWLLKSMWLGNDSSGIRNSNPWTLVLFILQQTMENQEIVSVFKVGCFASWDIFFFCLEIFQKTSDELVDLFVIRRISLFYTFVIKTISFKLYYNSSNNGHYDFNSYVK